MLKFQGLGGLINKNQGKFQDLIPMLCPPFLLTSLAGNPMFLLD